MKRIVLTFLLLSIPLAGIAQQTNEELHPVQTKPTMNLHSIMQTLVTVPLGKNDADVTFAAKRFRLILVGEVLPGKIGYQFQGEGLNEKFLLDMFFKFKGYVPHTTLNVGRALTSFSLYQPLSTGNLDFINYPFTTSKFAQWRQVGFWSETAVDPFKVTLGLYNGADVPDNWTDNNNAKDMFGRVDYSLLDGETSLKMALYGWYGYRYARMTIALAKEKDLPLKRLGGFVSGTFGGFRGAVEYVYGWDDYLTEPDFNLNSETKESRAILLQGMYRLNNVEGLFRYDLYNLFGTSEETWVTAGINYYIPNSGTMLFLDYVRKMELANDIPNDEILLQFQIAF